MTGWTRRDRLSAGAAVATVTGIILLGACAGRAIGAPATRDQLASQLLRERAQHQQETRALRRALRHSPSVREALTLAAVTYRVPVRKLSAVAWCESTHRPHARNGRYRGLFQQGEMFEETPYGQAGLSVWSPYAAAMSTASVVAREGWRQWECGGAQ